MFEPRFDAGVKRRELLKALLGLIQAVEERLCWDMILRFSLICVRFRAISFCSR